MAAFAAAIAAGLVTAFSSGSHLHINAPRTTQAALLASLMAQVMDSPAFSGSAGTQVHASLLMAVVFLALLQGGIVQIGLGLLRLGEMVKFVPQPILAGFVNGFVLLVFLKQAPYIVGADDWAGVWAMLHGSVAPGIWPLGLTLLAGGAALLSRRYASGLPATVVGLIVGTLGYHALAWSGVVTTTGLGPVLGHLPTGLPFHWTGSEIGAVLLHPDFPVVALSILATGITLGVVSSIQSLLSAATIDMQRGVKRDSNRELVSQGAANCASALLGGTVTGGSPVYTRLVMANGGYSPRASLVLAITLLGLVLGLGPVLGQVPLSVMSGMVIVSVAASVDDWTLRLIRGLLPSGRGRGARAVTTQGHLVFDLGIVALVSVLVMVVGVIPALGVGLIASFLLFLRQSHFSVVRRIYHGDLVRSRTGRSHFAMQKLREHGQAIAVIELNGPLFFGSAEHLASRVEQEVKRGGCATIILDFRRASSLDSTGALVLQRLDQSLAGAGVLLLLAGLPENAPMRRFLREAGFEGAHTRYLVYPDFNMALSEAEDRLLNRLDGALTNPPAMTLAEHPGLRNLTPAQINLLLVVLRHRTYAPGERIITGDDGGNTLYLLLEGTVSVIRKQTGGDIITRVATCQPGSIIGEMALVTGEPRSADVIADTPVVAYELASTDLAMLDSLDGRISFLLLQNIATELTMRVRRLNQFLHELEM